MISSICNRDIQNLFKLLGYSENCQIHYRGFYPKEDPRTQGEKPDKGRKVSSPSKLIPDDLVRWAEDKRGCYFVVNSGGSKDAEINFFRAIFYEHDDLEKDLQLTLWQILDLPEPTFQVDTGGKSIHSYWVFEQPITSEKDWRSLQQDLIGLAGSDPVIKNPARVMRLPGVVNPSTGQYARIVTQSGLHYTYDALRGIIPHRQKEQAIAPAAPIQNAQNNEDEEIFRALSFIPRRVANTGSYGIYRDTLWALKSKFGEARAIEIMEGHSPGAECGWNIPQVARSGGQHINIGTLFHHAKQNGWTPIKRSPQNNIEPSATAPNPSPSTEPKDLFEEFEKGYNELNEYAKRLLEIKDLEKRKFYAKKLAYKLRIDLGAVDAAMQREKTQQRAKEEVFVTVKQLFQEPEQDVKMLIPEVLPRGDLMVLSGKPGDGKSLLAYEIAYQVLNGGMFAGNHIKKGKVLFVQLDERKGTYKRRIESRGIDTGSEDFAIMRRFRLSDLSLLEEKLNDFRPDLIVIDNFRKAISGMGLDENKPEAADTLDPLIELLEDYDASCILIHHDNKNAQAQGQDRMSGSTNLISKAFSGFRIIRTSENPANTKIYMQSVKMRDGEPKKFEFNYERGENWYYSFLGEQNEDSQALSMIQRVADVIKTNTQPALNKYEFAAGQIRELLHLHETDKTIYTHLDRAEAKCLIKKRIEGIGKHKRTYYRLYDSPVSNFESTGQSTDSVRESTALVDSNQKNSNASGVNVLLESTSESTVSLQADLVDSNVIQITTHPRFESTTQNSVDSLVDSTCRLTEPLINKDSEKTDLSLQQNHNHTHIEPTTDAKPWGKAFSNTGTSSLQEVDIGGVKLKVGDKIVWRSPSSKWARVPYFQVEKLSQDRARVYPGQIDILLSEIDLYKPKTS